MEAKLDAASGCVIIKGRGWNTGDKDKWQLCVEGCTLPVNCRVCLGLVCVLRDSDVKVHSRWLNVTKVVDPIRPDFVGSGNGRSDA